MFHTIRRRPLKGSAISLIMAFSINLNINAESLEQYAANCKSELEIDSIPGFSCSQGISVGVAANQPDLLISSRGTGGPQSNLDLTARLGKVTTSNPNVDAVFLCRHISNGNAALTGYILQNRTTGKSCFFDAQSNKPAENIPAVDSVAGSNHWRSPSNLYDGGNCVSCHNNDPFIMTPALAQAAKEYGLTGHNRPIDGIYSVIGSDVSTNDLFNADQVIHSNDGSTCALSCHTVSDDFIENDSLGDWMPPPAGSLYTTFLDGPILHTGGFGCIHPSGGGTNPSNGTKAVLWSGCGYEDRISYQFTSAGSIKHESSGKCLHPAGGATNPADGTRLVFWSGCDLNRLAFEVTPKGQLRHKTSQKCIQATNNSSSGAELFFTTCSNTPLQKFGSAVIAGKKLVHKEGLCATSQNASENPANGTNVTLESSCNNPESTFTLLDSGLLLHLPSGKCVHPAGGSDNPSNGTNLVFWGQCTSLDRLKYEVTPSGSLKHITSGKCVHPEGGASNPSQGTELVLWEGCSEARLKFTFEPK